LLSRLSIAAKLTLLAGVPVLGALILASLLWAHAQRGAESAAALGSVEDLAELSVGMTGLVHELQSERALSALALGYRAKANDPLTEDTDIVRKRADALVAELVAQRTVTDTARAKLERFLDGRDLSELPVRLRRDLEASRTTLDSLSDIRGQADLGKLEINANVEFFAKANESLIGATAALTQLSDDGDLLRGISALVSVMQVKERSSQVHALLASVFAIGKFPPGTFRSFVSLTTEEQVYVEVLRATARDQDVKLYESSSETEATKRAFEMRKQVLDNIDDETSGDPAEWFAAQSKSVGALRDLETRLSSDVRRAAAVKLSTISSDSKTSLGLSAGVLVFSILLAGLIARGVAGSVSALTNAAAKVQQDNDFSVRAVKTTDDELGRLTVAFNEMLGGIQQRDHELDDYRRDLEKKVEHRTKELSQRNAAMRLVLDNVDQGLATIRLNGTLEEERSLAFDRWFGAPNAETRFGVHLARGRKDVEDLLEVAWDEVAEGFFPLELTIGQMPSQLSTAGREFTLSYKPILEQGRLVGALLIITDVTDDLARRRRDAEQSERIAIFESFMKDREGFIEFFNEGQRLLNGIVDGELPREELLRNLHTLKGLSGLYAVNSVASACHELETELRDSPEGAGPSLEPVRVNWARFASRIEPLMGGEGREVIVIENRELDEVVRCVHERRPHSAIETALLRFRKEPLSARFFRAGEQAKRLARSLGKPEPLVMAEANQVRLPREPWLEFWSAFTHVVRNAVDHGLESEGERLSAGKARVGSIRLSARTSPAHLELEVQDDGKGIDWDRVASRAKAMNLPNEGHENLVAALFVDSLTTVDRVSETSGRGVGMGAVLAATRTLGGTVGITSTRGKGTTITFKFPSSVTSATKSVGE
jgi:two-component system, chemotaxis family, sensor kinase CheA